MTQLTVLSEAAADTTPGRLAASRAERGRHQRRVDHVHGELRNRVVSLAIAPGSPIDETRTARELGVSRASVREAIGRLEADGLVTTFSNRGAFASTIGITDLSHVCDVRLALEGEAAQRAAQRCASIDHRALQSLRRDLTQGAHPDDPETQIKLYTGVHEFIYRCAANRFMEDTLNRYLSLSIRIWRVVGARLSQRFIPLDDLDRLLAAIADGAANRARALQVGHIWVFEEIVRAGTLSPNT